MQHLSHTVGLTHAQFPLHNGLHELLDNHDGDSNATTSISRTSYYFVLDTSRDDEAGNGALLQVLERFADSL
jgi:secreted Zn-dependent insulinase-like peptidase